MIITAIGTTYLLLFLDIFFFISMEMNNAGMEINAGSNHFLGIYITTEQVDRSFDRV